MANDISHSTKGNESTALTPVQLDLAGRRVCRRRRFSDEEKRHLLQLTREPGSFLADVARRYDLSPSLLFRWRRELGEGPAPFAGFVSVAVTDDDGTPTPGADLNELTPTSPAVEQTGGIEITLRDGKRVRIDAGADPEAVRRLVAVLEGATP
jgi:transposase